MRILISGSTGLVGKELVRFLQTSGHSVGLLVRSKSGQGFSWNSETGAIDSKALDGWNPQALVHLAGENIAKRRWTTEQKQRIRESRVAATKRLVNSLLALERPPPIFIGASAVGFYGNRGDDVLTEESTPGTDFLAQVCQEWERAVTPLRGAGTRVCHLRFGMILSREGGALTRMLPIFKAGLGARLASGRQWVSWITLGEVVRMIAWTLENECASGPYNATSPNPVTNAEFTRALGSALHRPVIFRVPAFVLRVIFGELAPSLLLSSQRATPERLRREGFQFEWPHLSEALAG